MRLRQQVGLILRGLVHSRNWLTKRKFELSRQQTVSSANFDRLDSISAAGVIKCNTYEHALPNSLNTLR